MHGEPVAFGPVCYTAARCQLCWKLGGRLCLHGSDQVSDWLTMSPVFSQYEMPVAQCLEQCRTVVVACPQQATGAHCARSWRHREATEESTETETTYWRCAREEAHEKRHRWLRETCRKIVGVKLFCINATFMFSDVLAWSWCTLMDSIWVLTHFLCIPNVWLSCVLKFK